MKRKTYVLLGVLGFVLGLQANGMEGRKAPVNPDFTAWRTKTIAARANATATASAGSGSTVTGLRPAPFDARYLVDLKKKRALKASTAVASKGSLPTSYDLRDYGWVTSIKDQNPYGTCWAHGALASMESALLKSEGTTYDFSENNMVNLCGFTFTSMNSKGQPYPWDGENEGGHYLMSLAYLLRWSGPVSEADDTYSSPGNSVAHEAQRHLIGCQWITQRTSYSDNDEIKQAVLDHGAVAIDYYHHADYLKGSSYYCPYSYSGNHLVAVVGWDDNYSKSNFATKPSGNGAFLIKNSWGTGFGSSGYFWVSYYDKTLGYGNPMVSYYNVDPDGNYENIYQYDELGFVGSLWTSEEGTGYGACIFTAKDSENISAVGFYALADTTSYKISVRTGVSATDPSSGTLATTVSGTAPHLGYVIVSLPSAVKVAKGANFAVTMKLTTDGYEYPLPYAAVSSEYSENEVISGKCYLSDDGTSWEKTTEEDICLKAYSTTDTGSTCEAAAGVWTTDVDGVKNASDCQLAVVLRSNYDDCGWCQQAQSVFESSEFLTWARNNGVYLVTADSTHLPDGCTDTSAALNWFSTLYSSISHTDAMIYYPTIAVARPDNFNQAVGYDIVRNNGSYTVGGVVYAGTAASLISGLSNYLGSSGDQPDAPTGLTASYTWNASASNYKVTLSWDNTWPSGTKFRIYRSSGIIADWDNPYDATTYTSFTDPAGLASGSTMHYWVTAQPSGSMEGIAASVTATAPAAPSLTLSSIAVSGASNLISGNTSTYTCTATYSDGSTGTVSPTWTITSGSSYASIDSSGVLTANTVSSTQSVTVKASYTHGGVTKTATKTVTINPIINPGTLSSITITGDSSVTSGGSAVYTCTATYSSSMIETVSPTWTITSGSSYASIDSSGVLTANTVSSTQSVTIKASYAYGGVTKTATKTVSITPVTTTSHTLTIPAEGGSGTVSFTLASSGYYHFAGANPDSWITSLSGSVTGAWSWSFGASDSSITLYANSTVTLNCSADANTIGSTRTWGYVITGPENHTITIQQLSQSSDPEPDPDPDPDPEGLTFTTGGDGDWYEQSEYTYDGESAWRSGAIDGSQETWLETTVSGEGVLSFYWYVSSESGYDDLAFYVDGKYVDSISGTYYDWQQKALEISGEGSHTVTWIYTKDSSVSDGLDAGFVDQVTFEAGAHLPNLNALDVYAFDGSDGLARCLFNVGDDIRFSYSYENSGLGDVVSSYANYLNTYTSDYISYTWGFFDGEMPLAAGTVVDGTLALGDLDGWSYLPAGVYTGYINIDNNSEISETCEWDNDASVFFSVRDPETLGNALDSELTFTTSGSDAWYGTKGYGSDGVDCAAALQTGDSTTNDLMTTVVGPKILSFKWKVSSEENYDWLQLLVDGEVKRQISGTADGWQDCQVKIPSGSHTVTWRYAKDGSDCGGVDCGWVDQVALSAVPSGSTCYGLFVGINRYEISANTLSGCVTDANSMKMVCQDYGDWPLYGMTVVTDYAATLARFKSEIASLAATAQAGDTVLIFDSGHGGSYTDDDGNYTKDTFLCTTDGYYEDTDFANDIAQFKSGVKVIVMLDTCHSAGMFKSKSSKSLKLSAATTSNPSFFDNFVANASATIDRSVRIKGASAATISSSDIGWIAAADYDVYSEDMGGMGLFTGLMVVDSGILNGNADANGDGLITFNELYEHSVDLSETHDFDQVAQAANTKVLDSVILNNRTVPLATALGNEDLDFVVSAVGDYSDVPFSWVGQNVGGSCCARCAVVPYQNEARMTTTVRGAGTISFKCRTEAANNGNLEFYVDGSCHYSVSRDTTWTDVYLEIEGDGDHEISWVYYRYYGSTGNDCGMVSDVKWIPVSNPTQVTVTFDPNGGECSEASRQVAVGENVGELPTPTWAAHSFLGWFTDSEGGDEVSADTIVTEDVTFYAHWQDNSVAPNWKNEIVKKNLKMTVYARIRDVAAKVLLEHTDGLLAAFAANGECRGCTSFQTDDDVNLFGLSVGIDSVSETGFTLKYWSSETGVIDVIDGFDANEDRQIGTFDAPVEYRVGAMTVEVTIDEGWNWVSIPVKPDNLAVGSVLSGYTWSNGDIVEAADGASTYYNGKWRSGDFTEIAPGAGYCIRKSEGGSETVEIAGAAIESSVAVDEGWNWIGSHSVDSVAMSDVTHSGGFANGDVVNSADGMSTYYNGKWRSGDFSALDPGAAYVAKFANAGVLSFGQSKSASARVEAMAVMSAVKGSAPSWKDDIVTKPKSVQLYCRISKSDGSGYIETAGSMLGAFTAGGECRGATTIIVDEDGAVFSVKVGAETETEDGFVLKVWDAATGEIYDVQGTFGFSDAVSGSIGLYWEPVTKIATISPPTTTVVIFSANGGVGGPSGSVTATKGKAMPAISGTPTKTGYTFNGYWDDPTAGVKYYNADLTSAKNWDKDDATATLYAQWTANTYTVTFHSNFGTDQTTTQTFTYDVEQKLKANGWNYEGHSFLGWAETSGGQKKFDDGEAVKNLSDVANGNVNLYAKWDVQMITVIIGGVVQEYEYGRQVTLTPAEDVVGVHGYTNLVCQGWSGGTGNIAATGTGSEVTFTVTQASTLNWLYQTNYYFEVTKDGNGSVGFDKMGLIGYGSGYWASFGTAISLSATADAHNNFSGWKNVASDSMVSTENPATFTVNEPLLLCACFATESFPVKFDLGDYGTRSGGGELTQTVEYGASAVAPTVTAMEGCIFKGWDSDGWKNVTGELTVKAVYDFTQYAISYENAHGDNSVNPKTYAVTNETITFAAPKDIPTGYHFQGWSPASIAKGSTGDRVVTAQWKFDFAVDGGAAAEVASGESVTRKAPDEGTWGETNIVCTGWIGTGSVPEKGEANTVTFTITEPSTLVWLYATNYMVRVNGGTLTDATREYALNGDWVAVNTKLTAKTELNTTNNYVNLVYRGTYTGTGDVTSGSGRQVSFTVTKPSSVTWNYNTNYCFRVTKEGEGTLTFENTEFEKEAYWPAGTSVKVTATADTSKHYHFANWTDVQTDAPLGNEAVKTFVLNAPTLVRAVFALDTFTVRFDACGKGEITSGNATQSVGFGQDATAPTVTAKPGYKFTGWDKAFNNITGDLTVTAQYETLNYTIAYEDVKGCDNAKNKTSFTVEDAVRFSSLTNPPGWKFLGWEPSAIEKGTASNVTVTAQWEHLKYAIAIDGVVGDGHYYGDAVTASTFAEKTMGLTNLVCIGWIGTGDIPATGVGTQVTFTVTQESSLTWLYQTNYWFEAAADGEGAITVGADGFAADVAGCWVPSGANLAVTAVPAEHVHFTGWKDAEDETVLADADEATFSFVMDAPALLEATFAIDTFTVVFDLGEFGVRTGGGEETQTVAYGKGAVAPTFDVAGDHRFMGWDRPFDSVTADMVVTAQYDELRFAIIYEDTKGCDNSANPTHYVSTNDLVRFSALTNPPGWRFLGWDPSEIRKGTEGAVTVTAQWEHIPYTIDVAGDASDIHHYYGEVVTFSEPPERIAGATNVVCVGWIGTGDIPATGVGTQVTFTVTQPSSLQWLYATNYWFEAAADGEGSITVGADGFAADVAGCWVPSGTNLVVTAVPAEHGHFAGWVDVERDAPVSSEAVLTVAMTGPALLSARFALDTFVVTFDIGDYGRRTGGGEESQTVEYGKNAIAPTLEVEKGYTFTGWDERFDVVTGDLVVLATYEETKYAITYTDLFDCDNAANPTNYTISDAVTFADPAKRAGWTFLGWEPAGIDAGTTGDVTVKALWREVPEIVDAQDVEQGDAPNVEKKAANYVGYLYTPDDGALAGTVQVTAGKGSTDKKTGAYTSKISVAIQLANESKKISISGKYDLTNTTAQTFSNNAKPLRSVTLLLGADGLTGSFEGYTIGGVPKATETADYQGSYNIFSDEGQFVVTVDKKGKAKVAGTTTAGKSVSASVALLKGEDNACVPVTVPKLNLAFTFWMTADETFVEGLSNAEVGAAGTLAEGATFQIDPDELAELIGDETFSAYFPNGLSVAQNAKGKWIVADGAKTGSVVLNKDGTVNEKKLGGNPSALKLTYTAKNGTFTGSFKAYYSYQANAKSAVKAKAVSFKVKGLLVNGIGYGTASAKIGKDTVSIGLEIR